MPYGFKKALDDGVEVVALEVDFGAGILEVDAAVEGDNLVEALFASTTGRPQARYQQRGNRAQLRFRPDEGKWLGRIGGRREEWGLHLNPRPAYEVEFKLGACRAELDLRRLKLDALELECGAAQVTITLGDHGRRTRGKVQAGAASVTLRVPRSVGVKVEMSAGFVSANFGGSGMVLGQKTWTSEGYESKAGRLELRVETGVSKFNLDWVD